MFGSLQLKLIALCVGVSLLAGILLLIGVNLIFPAADELEAMERSASRGWLILPLLISLGFSALIGSIFARSFLIKPILLIEETLQNVEQQWDLTHQCNVKTSGEIGDAGRAVNRFLQRLGAVLQDLSHASDQLAVASARISKASSSTAAGVEEQAAVLAQVAATVIDMSHDVEEISKVALNVASNAGRSREIAEDGSQIVREAADGMEAIKIAVMETSTSVNGLGERSRQIGEVIEVIGDIADQTNLLALNAAIEAARAGEHGRGFAVVADEVRKLAERTSRATREVSDVIASIQGETGRAVARMSTVAETVEEGVDRATSASRSLLEIVASTQEVSSMVERIAAAAADQNAKSRSISGDIKDISSMSKQLTTAADESAQSAQGASERAERLRTVMSQFTVPGGAVGGGRQNMMHTLTGMINRSGDSSVITGGSSREGATSSSSSSTMRDGVDSRDSRGSRRMEKDHGPRR